MELLKELKKQDTAIDLDNRYRSFKQVQSGKYGMSVQGSKDHYCSPRESINPLYYISMELALFGTKGQCLHITKSNVLKGFPRYNELIERADGLNSRACVYGFVPVDLLNDLYLYLKTQ